jgi:hypothetical protein
MEVYFLQGFVTPKDSYKTFLDTNFAYSHIQGLGSINPKPGTLNPIHI